MIDFDPDIQSDQSEEMTQFALSDVECSVSIQDVALASTNLEFQTSVHLVLGGHW